MYKMDNLTYRGDIYTTPWNASKGTITSPTRILPILLSLKTENGNKIKSIRTNSNPYYVWHSSAKKAEHCDNVSQYYYNMKKKVAYSPLVLENATVSFCTYN